MVNHLDVNCPALMKAIQEHVEKQYRPYLCKDFKLDQVKNISLHLLCMYLNHIDCPPNFAELYRDTS